MGEWVIWMGTFVVVDRCRVAEGRGGKGGELFCCACGVFMLKLA